MPEETLVLKGKTLQELLAAARDTVLRCGKRRESARGSTYSVSAMTLVWEIPSEAEENYYAWPKKDCDFYQRVFVEGRPENQPERLAVKGNLLFPYTYAARSRFWDGGWGYAQAVLRATRTMGLAAGELLRSEAAFQEYLAEAGELVHLQTLLAVWDWLGSKQMATCLEDEAAVEERLKRSRIDQLERVIKEIGENPGSRRAVTVSFVYPDLDQRLLPLLGIPPYQFFQLLPGEAGEPLNSFHVHRSLDAGQGVPLDFFHDYHWLKEAAQRMGRSLGTISITAGDFHVYLPSEKAPAVDRVEQWLLDVTDGYKAGTGMAARLLQKENYLQNARRIYRALGEEA